jgi:hypothetical protein
MFWNNDGVKTTAHAQVESITKLSEKVTYFSMIFLYFSRIQALGVKDIKHCPPQERW